MSTDWRSMVSRDYPEAERLWSLVHDICDAVTYNGFLAPHCVCNRLWRSLYEFCEWDPK